MEIQDWQCCMAQIMSLSICSGNGGQGHGTLCCCMSSSSGSGGQDHGILYVVHQVLLAMEVKVMVPCMLFIKLFWQWRSRVMVLCML